jgi:G3E family GTPase
VLTGTPVTVLTGYLGAGKTTLLKRLLENPGGRKIAVVQNEIARLDIDGDLVAHASEEVVRLRNGCLCCSVRGDIIRTLVDLGQRRPDLDHVVIETSGMADPSPLVATFGIGSGAMLGTFRLDGIVAVCDALHLEGQLERAPETSGQLGVADLIIVNKVDLATTEQRRRTCELAAAINPVASLVTAVQADVDPETILARGGVDADRLASACARPGPRHTADMTSVAIEIDGDLRGPRLFREISDFVALHGRRDLVRTKGIFAIAGMEQQVVIQSVHETMNAVLGQQWGDRSRLSRMVLIGRGLERLPFADALEGCRARKSRTMGSSEMRPVLTR